MLDSVTDVMSDRVESDFARQKISYRDCIGLWTTLLHLSSVKVQHVTSVRLHYVQHL